MKLLRLTTTDSQAVFDTILNTDLLIEPYSQIALSNASFTNEFKNLTLTGSNNTVTYNNGGGSQSAPLTLATYAGTESDSLQLFADMERQLNKKLVIGHPAASKDFGGRFSVKAVNGKNQIGYLISTYAFGDFNVNGNIKISGALGAQDRIVDTTDNIVTNDTNRIMWALPLVPGAGVFRTQVNMLTSLGGGSPATTGGYRMILGPLNNNPGNTIPSEQEKYMIGIVPDETDNTLYKFVFRDGAGTTKDLVDGAAAKIRPSTATQDGNGDATTTNDTLDLLISGGNVKGVVYKGTDTITAFTSAYDGTDLYGILVVRGGDSSEGAGACAVQNPRYTARDSLPGIDQRDNAGHLAAPPKPPAQRKATFTLDLSGCSSLADFLGFDVGTNNYVYSRTYTAVAQFLSQNGLTLGASDSYIVQLLTVPLDSYDTYSKGEFSILKVIPNLNQTADQRKCNYEASNLHFIDLKNSKPQTLRNIKARILTDELQPISTVHMSSITVLIKSKGEHV